MERRESYDFTHVVVACLLDENTICFFNLRFESRVNSYGSQTTVGGENNYN
mgnify:CR=1 FL=1